jgi:peptidyl-prolyl cis-trans isomerase B (cyclophilin B)
MANMPKKQKNRKLKKRTVLIVALCVLLLIIACCVISAFVASGRAQSLSSTVRYADIEVADYGTITVALDCDIAPETTANFIRLAESGFYNGLTFHRIIAGFLMQGGDPNGDGTGGSGQTIIGEFADNGIENPLSHTRGAISMARSDDYNSASSQFFIVQEDSTYLDGSYAVFGYVIEGMEIVDEICTQAKPIDANGLIAPEDQPVITAITIYP